MGEKPILFSGQMVRAILDGRKTQTRRVVKLPVIDRYGTGCEIAGSELNSCLNQGMEICPYGKPGDRLWVRETFHPEPSHKGPASYRATWPKDDEPPDEGWKPSIFMRRAQSRITLEIVSVRVERLQEIEGAPEDALAEGINKISHGRSGDYYHAFRTDYSSGNWMCPSRAYQELWESINRKKYPWNSNPWVWVVTFKQVFNGKISEVAGRKET